MYICLYHVYSNNRHTYLMCIYVILYNKCSHHGDKVVFLTSLLSVVSPYDHIIVKHNVIFLMRLNIANQKHSYLTSTNNYQNLLLYLANVSHSIYTNCSLFILFSTHVAYFLYIHILYVNEIVQCSFYKLWLSLYNSS